MAAEIRTGSYVGTAAAINVQLGWTPDYVKVWNETDGDEIYEWFSGMTAGHALKSTNNASTQFSKITSNGVSAYSPTDYSAKKGFTVGTAISESGKTFRYFASRNGDY